MYLLCSHRFSHFWMLNTLTCYSTLWAHGDSGLVLGIFVVQLLSCVWLFTIPWTTAHQTSLSFIISWSLLKLCPLSQWCHPTISSSVAHFSSCPQSFPASGSFPMNWLFTSGGHSIGASASASVLPMNIWGWFPLYWLVWSPCCPRDSQESSPAPQFEISSLVLSLLYGPPLTSIYDYTRTKYQ